MPSRDPQPIFGLLLPADPIGVEVPLLDLDGGSLTTREATGALLASRVRVPGTVLLTVLGLL